MTDKAKAKAVDEIVSYILDHEGCCSEEMITEIELILNEAGLLDLDPQGNWRRPYEGPSPEEDRQ